MKSSSSKCQSTLRRVASLLWPMTMLVVTTHNKSLHCTSIVYQPMTMLAVTTHNISPHCSTARPLYINLCVLWVGSAIPVSRSEHAGMPYRAGLPQLVRLGPKRLIGFSRKPCQTRPGQGRYFGAWSARPSPVITPVCWASALRALSRQPCRNPSRTTRHPASLLGTPHRSTPPRLRTAPPTEIQYSNSDVSLHEH